MYTELEPLASLRISKAIEKARREHNERDARTMREFAARGLARSGPASAAMVTSYAQWLEDSCRAIADIWLDLILKLDGRLSEESVRFITQKVEEFAAQQVKARLANRQPDDIVAPGYWEQQLRMKQDGVVGAIRRDLEIQRREQELFASNRASSGFGDEVFVVMAAHDELKPLYQEAIEPAIKATGLGAYLMIKREPEHAINDEILSRIESSRLLIADLTFERPNCYYEVGYAHAKGQKVIFTAREDHDPRRPNRKAGDPKIHFDLDSHRFSLWVPGSWEPLRAELELRLRESLEKLEVGRTPLKRRSEEGEGIVLSYLQQRQSGSPGKLLFQEHFVAQELGWPLEDVRLVLKRMTEKGWLRPEMGGYVLKSG